MALCRSSWVHTQPGSPLPCPEAALVCVQAMPVGKYSCGLFSSGMAESLVCLQVDVSEEEDQFQAVTTACLNVLILAVETRLDGALQQMTRMPWATLETVSALAQALPASFVSPHCQCCVAPDVMLAHPQSAPPSLSTSTITPCIASGQTSSNSRSMQPVFSLNISHESNEVSTCTRR